VTARDADDDSYTVVAGWLMARRPSPPTQNMREILVVLSAGPMTWRQIQTGLAQQFEGLHGAVLIGILNRMITRGLIVQDGDQYRLA
jgi:hypothetical protein